MKNTDIRDAAKAAGIYLWEIAEEYGCSDATFSRWLRRELPSEEKQRIFQIIERLSGKEAER